MPITKSAKKALRQNLTHQARNLAKKNKIKNIRRDIKKLLMAGKVSEAQMKLTQLYKALDKAAKTNVIKKNKAARLKSRITKSVQKALQVA
ncbi:MAG: 30S ribosomal protein S20 [Nitrospinota bacterium]